MANRIHTNDAYGNVGMLQVMNEPVHSGDYPSEAANMVSNFYPQALKAIRDAESAASVSGDNRIHVQFMVSRHVRAKKKKNSG
jgi:glucan endo-1,6-beta-glucosidase